MSLFDIVLIARELYAAIQAKDWAGILAATGKLAASAAEFFKAPKVAAAASDAAAEADLTAVLADLKGCCAPAAVGADPKAIDPATILLIIQTVAAIIEAIRKRRQG